jgi:hypothetical protein
VGLATLAAIRAFAAFSRAFVFSFAAAFACLLASAMRAAANLFADIERALGVPFILKYENILFFSFRLAFFDALVQRLTILTNIKQNHTFKLQITATQARVYCPRALLPLFHFGFAHNFTTRFGHCQFIGRETACCFFFFRVKNYCS